MSMTPERLDKWSARLALVKFPEGTTASFLTCSEILQLIAAARLGLESAEKQQCSSAGHICVGECQHYIDQKQQIETLTRERDAAIKETQRIKEIGQGFERDSQKFFEQSCKNLQRAEKAESERDTALKQVEELTKAKDELEQWLYRITLKIQTTDFESHRAEAFQEAYQLYVKYNADRFDPNYENRMKAITTAMKEKA